VKCPCKGCDRRTLTCHGVCKGYQDWKKYNTEKMDWLRQQNARPVSDSVVKMGWKNMKRRKNTIKRVSKEG
jgi:hypothetical protein